MQKGGLEPCEKGKRGEGGGKHKTYRKKKKRRRLFWGEEDGRNSKNV